MAPQEVSFQFYFVRVVIVVVCIVIVFKYFKRYVRHLHFKVYAWLISKSVPLYNWQLAPMKERLFAELKPLSQVTKQRLTILEIGAGSGANFAFYPDNSSVMCIDPNPCFVPYLEKNAALKPDIKFEFSQGSAEDMRNIPSESVDVVVATLVLCTIRDIDAALLEVKRILKPGGKFYYMEHVCADENTWTYKMQKLYNPINYQITHGCSLLRKTWNNIDGAGFSHVKHEHFWVQFRLFAILRPHLMGTATK